MDNPYGFFYLGEEKMMNDLINRQEAINAICAICGLNCDKSEFRYNCPQDEQVILCPEHYVLYSLPSVNQWIPITEMMPEEGTEVLGTDDNGCIRHVVKDKSGLYEFATYEEMMHIEIVAWLPLPEPY